VKGCASKGKGKGASWGRWRLRVVSLVVVARCQDNGNLTICSQARLVFVAARGGLARLRRWQFCHLRAPRLAKTFTAPARISTYKHSITWTETEMYATKTIFFSCGRVLIREQLGRRATAQVALK
jgi:hypothetical protein